MGAVKQEELLERIAVALEGIDRHLTDISESLDSLDKGFNGLIAVNRDNRFLCITGNVMTD